MNITITTPKGTVNVTGLVPTAKWSGDFRQAARSLDFSVLASAEDQSVPVVACPLGAGVQLSQDGKILFDGFIISRRKSTDESKIILSCYDRGFYLKRNKASYKFVNTAPEAAAAQVAADFGLPLGELAATGVQISRNFIAVSLYDILATLYTTAAKRTGKQYHIGFAGEKLCVREKGQVGRTVVLQGKSNLIAADTTESIEKMVNAVAIYDKSGTLLSTQEDAALVALYGRMQEALTATAQNDRAAEAAKLLEQGGVSQKITVDCLGDTGNITGGCVMLREPYTGLYGLFYIDGDTHEWKRGQYYNKLVLNFQSVMDEKEAGSLLEAESKKASAQGAQNTQADYVNRPGDRNAG